MGICGSKESSGDANVSGSSKHQGLKVRNGTSKNGPSKEAQDGKYTGQDGKIAGNDMKKGELSINPNKAEKADSARSQTTTSQVMNGNEKSINKPKDKEVKVLLLGAGESGKSTIIQQLKILHQNGFSNEEKTEYRAVVYRNILDIGKDLVDARKKFNVELDEGCGISESDIEKLYSYDETSELVEDAKAKDVTIGDEQKQFQDIPSLSTLTQFPTEIYRTISVLWDLPSTKKLLNGDDRSRFYLMDSTQYFMSNISRIAEANYIPNDQDILRSRQKTSGIFDSVFDVGSNLKLHIYDVGGQRSERKKWIHCFDNVTLIIFCVSLSEYDQQLLEDQTQNRFQESLVLFDNVINSRWFSRTSVVLFLNKIDLFAEKLQKVPLETYFPDYTGGKDINKAAKYILWRFVQLNRANLNIYPHVTQATDTSNIKLVFAAIKETLLENALKDTGVL